MVLPFWMLALKFYSLFNATLPLLRMHTNGNKSWTHKNFRVTKALSNSPLGLPQLRKHDRGLGWGTHLPQNSLECSPKKRVCHSSAMAWRHLSQPSRKLRPKREGARTSHLGSPSAHRSIPVRPLGIKWQKAGYTGNERWLVWLWHRRPKPKRWSEKKWAAQMDTVTLQTKRKAWSQEVKSSILETEWKPKGSSHDPPRDG